MTTKELFGLNLKNIRKAHGITAEELAKKVNVAKGTVSYWENGVCQPSSETLDKICSLFNISPLDLYSPPLKEIKEVGDTVELSKIPVFASIAAGIPIEANEDIIDYIDVPTNWLRRNNYFAIKVKGNSMSPTVKDGDIVVVKQQETAETGKICVVLINGYEATLKEIKKDPNGLWILPKNPDSEFKPSFFTNQEVEELPIRILGVAVEIRRSL